MVLSIPRSCIGNPEWVRVSPFGQRYDYRGPKKGIYYDSALNKHGNTTRKLTAG